MEYQTQRVPKDHWRRGTDKENLAGCRWIGIHVYLAVPAVFLIAESL